MVLFKLILDRPVLDVYGKSIICDGGWNANINQKQFSSTVTKIHKSRGESGLYSKYHLEIAFFTAAFKLNAISFAK